MTDDLAKCRGFQWDEGNAEKNWVKHHVSRGETEQVFFNRPLVVVFIVFTIREDLIRVISARPMSRQERKVYEHAKEEAAETDPEV
jgi:uncharacterized DUF497 family protein